MTAFVIDTDVVDQQATQYAHAADAMAGMADISAMLGALSTALRGSQTAEVAPTVAKLTHSRLQAAHDAAQHLATGLSRSVTNYLLVDSLATPRLDMSIR